MRRSTRRQFILGKSALDAMEDLADQIDAPALSPPASRIRPASSFLLHCSRRAMACNFTVYLNAGEASAALETAIAALDHVDRLEDQLTVYRESSEVSRLNRSAADGPFQVAPNLFELLTRCHAIYAATDRAFDITAGPLSKTWGFYRRQGRVPTNDELQAALECVGSDKLGLDAQNRTVTFTRPGMEINLGGIGKGYALDHCAQLLTLNGVENFVIHGGNSSVLSRGSRTDGEMNGWQIEIRHPLRSNIRIARLVIRDQAVGTSGSATQNFHVGHRRYGHIIDPRTGIPADGILSVTAVAPDAATADALGTAFYVLGTEATAKYCQTHADIGALIIRPGERSGDVCVDLLNLDTDTVHLYTI